MTVSHRLTTLSLLEEISQKGREARIVGHVLPHKRQRMCLALAELVDFACLVSSLDGDNPKVSAKLEEIKRKLDGFKRKLGEEAKP